MKKRRELPTTIYLVLFFIMAIAVFMLVLTSFKNEWHYSINDERCQQRTSVVKEIKDGKVTENGRVLEFITLENGDRICLFQKKGDFSTWIPLDVDGQFYKKVKKGKEISYLLDEENSVETYRFAYNIRIGGQTYFSKNEIQKLENRERGFGIATTIGIGILCFLVCILIVWLFFSFRKEEEETLSFRNTKSRSKKRLSRKAYPVFICIILLFGVILVVSLVFLINPNMGAYTEEDLVQCKGTIVKIEEQDISNPIVGKEIYITTKKHDLIVYERLLLGLEEDANNLFYNLKSGDTIQYKIAKGDKNSDDEISVYEIESDGKIIFSLDEVNKAEKKEKIIIGILGLIVIVWAFPYYLWKLRRDYEKDDDNYIYIE